MSQDGNMATAGRVADLGRDHAVRRPLARSTPASGARTFQTVSHYMGIMIHMDHERR
jgi:hypothetical protein